MRSMKSVLLVLAALPVCAQERTIDRVLPALAACTSAVQLQNLGERPVTVTVEAYTENGALVALKGHPAIAVELAPRERETYRLELPDETTEAWIRVREMLAAEPFSSVVTVSGSTQCGAGNEMRPGAPEGAFP